MCAGDFLLASARLLKVGGPFLPHWRWLPHLFTWFAELSVLCPNGFFFALVAVFSLLKHSFFVHLSHFLCCFSVLLEKTYFGYPPAIPWFQQQEVTPVKNKFT